jgi:hypothetical protein
LIEPCSAYRQIWAPSTDAMPPIPTRSETTPQQRPVSKQPIYKTTAVKVSKLTDAEG